MSAQTTGAKLDRINELPPEPISPATLNFIAQVERAYTALMQSSSKSENLGGKLLFAGELNDAGRALAAAANIAGAATLAASADASTPRQAMRDGIIDFLVNSLDEALRILKNEIRKQQPVAVGVSHAPEIIVNEMLDRGVLPDLLPPLLPSHPSQPEFAAFLAQGARRLQIPPLSPGTNFLIWPIPTEYTQRPADFDALLLKHLPPDAHAAQQWLHLSPRYLGAQARRLRSLSCDEETTSKLKSILGPPLFSSPQPPQSAPKVP